LIPSWAKDMSIGNKTLNARSESVTTTPAFRDSILTKRCLIPADGFYEWRKMGSVKQPYCFEVGEGEVFALAGLWDQWTSPDGEIIESCTILTTTPNSLVADLHDRMPVIVPPAKYNLWLAVVYCGLSNEGCKQLCSWSLGREVCLTLVG
jgi:putative SOS response-associated peptidase YedK